MCVGGARTFPRERAQACLRDRSVLLRGRMMVDERPRSVDEASLAAERPSVRDRLPSGGRRREGMTPKV